MKFEGLKDDYQIKKDEIREISNKYLNQIKLVVDEYMYYILDDYQDTSEYDSISNTDFLISYYCISVPMFKVAEFIRLLKSVSDRIEKDLEVEFLTKSWWYFDNGEFHNVNHALLTPVNTLEKWFNDLSNLVDPPKYKMLKLEIIIR